MKKLFILFILTTSAAMLNADYYDSYGYGGNAYGGCGSQNQPGAYPQGPQGPQGAYPQGPMQGRFSQYQGAKPNQPGQFNQGPEQGRFSQYQGYGQEQRQPGAAFGQPGSNQQQYGQPGQPGQPGQNDQQLNDKIRDSLRSAFSDKYNNVQATANNGVVTLSGTVNSQDDKKDLEDKVRNINGVRSVNNQVQVQGQQGQQGQGFGQPGQQGQGFGQPETLENPANG